MSTLLTTLSLIVSIWLVLPESSFDEPRVAGDTIRDATRMEHSPDFNDLYLIQAEDRFRQIHVYCNSGGCYKLRGAVQSV